MPIDYKAVIEKRKAEKKAAALNTSMGNTDFKFSSN
jgi:hypothetical protein